jgi:predicted MFS family arabinose efflux permease
VVGVDPQAELENRVTLRRGGIILGIQNRWVMLAVLFLARTAMALQFQTVASTGPFLIDALAIDFASLGALIGLFMLPGVVIALPGGMLGQRFGAKRVVLIGLALMAIGGVLMGMSASFAMAAAGRLICGTGAVLFNVFVTKMVTDWFAGREITIAMAILVSSWPLGLALGLVFFGPLAAVHGWQPVMHIGALSALIALVLLALAYRDPPDIAPSAAVRFTLDLTRREWVLVVIAGTTYGIFNVAYIVLVSFTPEIFTARGWSLSEASWIVSMLGWSLIASIPFSGFVVERIGRPNLAMTGSFLIVAGALAALPFVGAPLVAFALVGLVIGIPPGPLMALPAQALRVETRSGGMGVFYTCYYVAMAILPGIAGLALDLSGSPAAPALFAAVMMLLCALGVMLFHAAKRMPQH